MPRHDMPVRLTLHHRPVQLLIERRRTGNINVQPDTLHVCISHLHPGKKRKSEA